MIQKFVAKLSDKERNIFYVMVAFILMALIWRLLLAPMMDRLSVIDDQIEREKDIIVLDIKFLARKDQIVKQSQAYEKYFTQTIEDDDVVNAEFLSIVEQLATQSNVNLIKSNPSSSTKEKDYTEYYANLDCTGSLKDVITFMHSVNSSDDLLKVVRFSMSPQRDSQSDVNASMTVIKLIVSPDGHPQTAALTP